MFGGGFCVGSGGTWTVGGFIQPGICISLCAPVSV